MRRAIQVAYRFIYKQLTVVLYTSLFRQAAAQVNNRKKRNTGRRNIGTSILLIFGLCLFIDQNK